MNSIMISLMYLRIYQEIIDFGICCRPSKITIEVKNKVFTRFEISDGDE